MRARDHSLPGRGPATAWRRMTLCLVLALWVAMPAAADGTLAPYVGRELSNNPLSHEQLREIFFVRQSKWRDGTPIRVFVLRDDHPLHIRFAKEILGVYPYQLRSVWDRMLFAGTGVPPTVVDSTEEMRRRVEETRGSIGYLGK
ncbi:MAG: hypothetical protein ACREYF_23775 [Gammaproteobacteria bacterium]